MDEVIVKILRDFEERAAREWEQVLQMDSSGMQRNLDEFLLSIGPQTGQLINLLAKEAKAQTILEIGSSYGYSTVWLAEAARATGGKVISLEIHRGKQESTRDTLERAGLSAFVDFMLGDARESLAALREDVDFVLLDVWKDLYIPCFDLFYPMLQPAALIVADNMVFPESARECAAEYRKHVRTKPHIDSVLLPVGSGIELSRYK
jgi:predicted O-methyltransferase YrrM